jgi:hypothetical protein
MKEKIINPARLEIELDCGNTHMTKLENYQLEEKIRKIIESFNIKVVEFQSFF